MERTNFRSRLSSYGWGLSIATAVLMQGGIAGNAQAQVRLEEIIVTARKTEERLQDVPITVTAFTARELTERGVDDLYKVSQFTPGYSFEKLGNRYGSQNGGVRPVIRGMSSIGSEPNAAFFVDGILYSNNPLSFPFDIVERVEVIKGPQSALFGRATFAGAINLITKKGSNDFENKVSVRAAEYDDYEVNLLSRGPLVEDKVFYMLHGRYYDFGGQYRNEVDNQKVGQEQSYGINGSLEFRASENFTATFSGGYNEDDDGLAPSRVQDRFSNNCFLDVARQYYCGEVKPADGPAIVTANLLGQEGLKRDSLRLMGNLEYEFGNGFTITSSTGYFDTDDQYGYDSDYQDGGRINTNLRLETSAREEWSTELRLQSPQDQQIRYLAGVYYYNRDRAAEQRRLAPGFADLDLGRTVVDNIAGFGAVTADFTETLTGSMEMRYAKDELKFEASDGSVYTASKKTWLPRLTLDWKPTEESLVYAVFAKGNKPGDVNDDPRLPVNLIPVGEEKSWFYEAGTKNSLLDGRLNINAAAFYIDWSNQQLTDIYFLPDGTTTVSHLVNVGKTKIEGLEFSMNGAFSDYFSAGFTYAINDATFVEFNDAEAGLLFGETSVKGKESPNSPKHQISAFGRISYPLTDEVEGFFRADFSYASEKYAQIYNLASTGDQKLLNLRMGADAGNWMVTLFVDNVTNDKTPPSLIRYVDNKNRPFPIGDSQRTSTTARGFLYSFPDRRQFGVTASYSF